MENGNSSEKFVEDEDDFLAILMDNYHLGEFPKVSQIATTKLSPDIDLLHVDESQRIVIGYELKLLKYNKRWKQPNFISLYTGIGQALSLFKFGVDRSYLILGISKRIPKDSSTKQRIQEIAMIFECLRNSIEQDVTVRLRSYEKALWGGAMSQGIQKISSLRCFGIMYWDEHTDSLSTILEAGGKFPNDENQDFSLFKQCLLKKHFKYAESFRKNIKKCVES